MKRLAVILFGLSCAAVLGAVFADTPKPESPVKDPTPEDGRHFTHDTHEEYLKKIGIDVWAPEQCKFCHPIDDKGNALAPVAQGHAPCLRSGCHADEFMAINKKRRAEKGGEYLKAATFCVACHSEVPWPWKPPKTYLQESWRNQREHHIALDTGMDHYKHITLAKKKDGSAVGCRDCHVVGNDFALAKGTPGHGQCIQCHSPGNNAFPLTECGKCHKKMGRTDWIKKELSARNVPIDEGDIDGSRPKSSVMACGSQRHMLAEKQFKRKVSCFKHETAGHRLTQSNAPIQCVQCHSMIGDEKLWAGRTFKSIIDLHSHRIIGSGGQEAITTFGCPPGGGGPRDKNDAQHAACSGGTACHKHAKQVDLDCPDFQRKCDLCHAKRTNNEAF